MLADVGQLKPLTCTEQWRSTDAKINSTILHRSHANEFPFTNLALTLFCLVSQKHCFVSRCSRIHQMFKGLSVETHLRRQIKFIRKRRWRHAWQNSSSEYCMWGFISWNNCTDFISEFEWNTKSKSFFFHASTGNDAWPAPMDGNQAVTSEHNPDSVSVIKNSQK